MNHLEYDIFVGCYGTEEEETIHWLTFDTENGKLRKKRSFKGVENPSFVTTNHEQNRLYAVSEVEKGEVVSFEIDFKGHTIREMNRQLTKGGPCYLEVGENGNHLFTANYGGGSLIVHALNRQGEIAGETDFKEYNASNSSHSSHIHTIRNIPNTTNYVATDLGLNQLYFYEFDREERKLLHLKTLEAPQGSGPRHIAFHPFKNLLYVVNEYNSMILTYAYDKPIQNVHLLQELPTLPSDYKQDNYGADIHVTPSGKFVYVSNRGHHSITGYKILENGHLSSIGSTTPKGDWPRNFMVIPNEKYILVANEHTNNIVVMKILKDGGLKYTGQQLDIKKPVCLRVVSNSV